MANHSPIYFQYAGQTRRVQDPIARGLMRVKESRGRGAPPRMLAREVLRCSSKARACARPQTGRPTRGHTPMVLVQPLPLEARLKFGEPVASFYETLEVSPRASSCVIRAAYRCLVQHHHPDKNPDAEGAGQRLVLINEAYAVLSDAAKRMSYDLGLVLTGGGDERRGLGAARHTHRAPSSGNSQTSRPFGFRKLYP